MRVRVPTKRYHGCLSSEHELTKRGPDTAASAAATVHRGRGDYVAKPLLTGSSPLMSIRPVASAIANAIALVFQPSKVRKLLAADSGEFRLGRQRGDAITTVTGSAMSNPARTGSCRPDLVLFRRKHNRGERNATRKVRSHVLRRWTHIQEIIRTIITALMCSACVMRLRCSKNPTMSCLKFSRDRDSGEVALAHGKQKTNKQSGVELNRDGVSTAHT